MAEITSQADCGHYRCYGACGYQQAAKPQAPTADELLAEVKRQAAEIERLRAALKYIKSDLFLQIESKHGPRAASEYPSIVLANAKFQPPRPRGDSQ